MQQIRANIALDVIRKPHAWVQIEFKQIILIKTLKFSSCTQPS